MAHTNTKADEVPVQIWERLEVVIGPEGKEGVYSCRVTDIKTRLLEISRPVFEYGNSLLANDRDVLVRFTRADAAYSFRARLHEAEPKQTDLMYLINPSRVQRIQRRRFVRLDMVLPLQFATLNRPVPAMVDVDELKFVEARTLNVSAGGVALEIKEDIPKGSLLVMRTSGGILKNLPEFILCAHRHSRPLDGDVFVAGVEFILSDNIEAYLRPIEVRFIPDIVRIFNSRMQNNLVSELFAEQLVLRQKGLI